jgi:Spy/CpxP family protein refolding chaperone
MKRFKPARLIGHIGLVVVATAAGTAMAAPPPATGQEAPTTCEGTATVSTPETPIPAVSGDPYGPQKLIADALSKVCLSDQQRTAIEQLGKEVRPKEEAVADARHAFVKALAEQVRTDHVDAGALKPEIDALVKAREDASPVMRKALDDLHGILDSGQRAAFVGALEADMKQLRDKSAGWFDSLAQDLGFTDVQKARIKDDLTRAQNDLQMDRDRAKAAFDSFKGDDFSIEKVSPESDVGPRTRTRAEGMVTVAKEVADTLTPEQRSKLADRIESKAAGGAPSGGAPSTPSTGTPGTPSYGTPSYGTPSTGAPSGGGMGTSPQGLIVGGGYRAGAIGGWGGGFYGGAARFGGVRTGYAAGYPFMGGWGPGIW